MNAETCGKCGKSVGERHYDFEEISAIKELISAEKYEKSHDLGLVRETGMNVVYRWLEPVRHRVTVCEACVRGWVAERAAQKELNAAPTPLPEVPKSSKAAEYLTLPAILAVLAGGAWALGVRWAAWALLGAIPLSVLLIFLGRQGAEQDAAAQAQAASRAQAAAAQVKDLTWDEVLRRAKDGLSIFDLHSAVVSLHLVGQSQRQIVPATDHHAIPDRESLPTRAHGGGLLSGR